MNRLVSCRIKQSGTAVWMMAALLSCTAVSTGTKNRYIHEKDHIAGMERIREGAALLKDGDLVVRTGNDFVSSVLRRFSQTDKTYSHCGLARVENGRLWVYHAIGGEDNPKATLRKESFASFCNPKYNLGFGIFRYTLTKKEKLQLDSLSRLYFRKKIPFDMQFDLNTDSSFYCAEFVYKILRQVAGSDYLPVSHLGDFTYVAIDNLYINRHTCAVFQARF